MLFVKFHCVTLRESCLIGHYNLEHSLSGKWLAFVRGNGILTRITQSPTIRRMTSYLPHLYPIPCAKVYFHQNKKNLSLLIFFLLTGPFVVLK